MKLSKNNFEINIYAMISVLFIAISCSFIAGMMIGESRAKNQPFQELVDLIKDNKSVFVINRKDAEYLVEEIENDKNT